jgi:hypothetical protein
MSEPIIKYSDLINDDGGFLKLEKDLESLGKSLEEKAKSMKASLSFVNPNDTVAVSQYEAEIKALKKSIEQLKATQEKTNQTKKKQSELTRAERIEIEKQREANRKANLEAKNIVKVNSASAGSIEQLRAKLALVTLAWGKLSEEERQNSDRGKRLVESKRQLTEQLKAEELATGDARRNVGNYKESIIEALKEMQRLKAEKEKELAILKEEQQQYQKNTQEFHFYQIQINKTTQVLNKMNVELNETVNNAVEVQNTVGGLRNSFGMLAGVAGAIGIGVSVSELKDVVDGFKDIKIQAQQLGYEGDNLDRLAVGSKALADTFKDDQGEVLRSANTIVKEFGGSVESALKSMENGYLTGANAQGDLTDQVKEYSSQIKASGGDVNTLFAIISKSNKAGIFSDKGVDAVKEFGLRIREQTTATSDAMNNAFGKEFTDKIFNGINDGSITSIEALEMISKKMNDTEIPANKLQTVIADVFGGPGEDAGLKFLKTLTDISSATDSVVNSTDPLIIQQQETLRLNEELAQAQLSFAESIGGTNTTIDQLILRSKILFFQYLIPAVGWIAKLGAGFLIFKGYMVATSQEFKSFISNLGKAKTEASQTEGGFKGLGNALKGIGWTIAIGLAIEFARALWDVASGAKSAREQHENLQKAMARGNKQAEEFVSKRRKVLDSYKKEQELLLSSGEISQKEFNSRIAQKEKEYIEKTKYDIKYANESKQRAIQEARELGKIQKIVTERFDENGKEYANYIEMLNKSNELGGLTSINNQIDILKQRIGEENEMLKVFHSSLNESGEAVHNLTLEQNESAKSTSKANTEIKSSIDLLKLRIELVSEEARIRQEIRQMQSQAQADALQREIEKELEILTKQAEDFGNADLTNLKDLINQRAELLKKSAQDEQQFKINELEASLVSERQVMVEQLQEQRDELLKQEKLTTVDKAKIQESYRKRLSEIDEAMLIKEKEISIEKERLAVEYGQIYDQIERERVEANTNANESISNAQSQFIDDIRRTEKAQTEESLILLQESIDSQLKLLDDKNKKAGKAEIEAYRNLLKERYELRKRAIEDEYDLQLSRVEKGSQEEIAIQKEKDNELLKLKLDWEKESKEIDKRISDNQKSIWKEFTDTLKQALQMALDEWQKQAQKEVKISEDKLAKQNQKVDEQRQRAQNGLANTYAFELKEQAKREAELLRSQKRLERAEKVKSLYSSYQNYANSGEKNPILKTLKDLAILQGVAASFGDGGVVEDKLPRDGIFRGPSHRSKSGGIPIMVEGKEGIFSVREMANLGKDNFYKIKELASKGKFDIDMIRSQRRNFDSAVPIVVDNSSIGDTLKLMNSRLDRIESEKMKFSETIDGFVEIIHEVDRKGKKTINRYPTKARL